MTERLYLIDTNCLITAKNSYYPFDFASGFWDQLKNHINSGEILIHQAVYDELGKYEDELTLWLKDNITATRVKANDIETMNNFSQILVHIQNCGLYKNSAYQNWSRSGVADPILIASAVTHGYVLVTNEVKSGGRSKDRPSKNPKIPDVANDFEVECVSLFDMMRSLGFHL